MPGHCKEGNGMLGYSYHNKAFIIKSSQFYLESFHINLFRFGRTGYQYVAQADLNLLGQSDPPVSTSQVAGAIIMNQCFHLK